MINKLKIYFLFILFFFSLNVVHSEETYCLDKDGLILPLFDEKECLNSKDIKINQNEFSYIIDHKSDQRLSKLEYFRDNPDLFKKSNEENLSISKAHDKKELTPSEKRKIELKQKKLARLAKELERKELLKANKEKRLLDQKKRKAELRKKNEIIKKKAEEKRLRKIADRKKKIEERKLKAKARKIEVEKKRLQKIAEKKKIQKEKEKEISKSLAKKNSEKIIDKEKKDIQKSINEKLKIILIENQIVNYNLFPEINGNLEIVKKENITKDFLDNLVEFNKNILVLLPKDFETSSVRVSENRLLSKVVIGIDQIPNPEINRIEAELRRAEQDYYIAERKFQRGTAAATNYNPYGGWASVLNQWAGLAEQSQAKQARDNARQRLERWSAKLSSTPMYLEKERLGTYNYDVVVIKSEKKSVYDVLNFNNGKFYSKTIKFDDVKNFSVAYGLNPQDKSYNKLVAKYSTEKDVSLWSNKKMKNISIDKLKTKIQTSGEFEKLKSKKLAYNFLGQDIKIKKNSFWGNLFDFGSKKEKKNKIASLTNNSSYETKDTRFDSVVVVKTKSGMGSGFFISKDEIITNYHVVEDSMSISIVDINKRKSSAVVIKKDLKRDLALLKTNMKGKPVEFYDGQLKQGEMVEALGHPKGRKFSLTKGWISAIRKENSTYSYTETGDVLFIQTDAAINPGNSGGPLYYKGRVVGVNTQGLHKDKTEGMNFAVHFSEVKKFLSN